MYQVILVNLVFQGYQDTQAILQDTQAILLGIPGYQATQVYQVIRVYQAIRASQATRVYQGFQA